MEYTALVILAALAQYLLFSARVATARGKYGVKAPATSGHEIFDRHFRVQMNTLEQLIVFFPALVLFSLYVSDAWAVLPGVVWLAGRQLYAYEYVSDPKSRGPGMALTGLASVALMIGAATGIILKLF